MYTNTYNYTHTLQNAETSIVVSLQRGLCTMIYTCTVGVYGEIVVNSSPWGEDTTAVPKECN